MAEFDIEADSEYIRIDGFTFAPAEADEVKSAISFAGGMRDFPTLPPQLAFERFVVKFYEDGTLTLERSGDETTVIKFDFDSIDSLIVAITSGLDISIDKKRLSPSPRHVGSLSMFNSGDVIEGR